jgi:hypothetical protein
MDVNESALLSGAAGDTDMREVREMGTPVLKSGDFFPPELIHLLGTASRVIDQHVNDHGECADCGSIWPCHHAQLAEFALAAL